MTAQRTELLRYGGGVRPAAGEIPEDRQIATGRADRRRSGRVVAPARWLMEREWASRVPPHD